MRLWPRKKWKKIMLSVLLAIVVVAAASLAYVGVTINRDVVSRIEIINAVGSKTALVVYQPGLSSFPKDISYAFANGLALAGWRVKVTTASPQASSDLSNYSLLVLGFPIYGGNPGAAEVRYVGRLSNLQGIEIVIIATGAGSPGKSAETMKQKVLAAGGTVEESLTLFSMAPNEGNGSATDIARNAGTKIAP
ncbi:MAG: hypothetical protein ABSD42_06590 [Candidatus Bathyarchaeia archaeon]